MCNSWIWNIDIRFFSVFSYSTFDNSYIFQLNHRYQPSSDTRFNKPTGDLYMMTPSLYFRHNIFYHIYLFIH